MGMYVVIGFGVLTILGWLYALRDIAFSTFKTPSMKIVFILMLLLFPLMGVLGYFLLRRYLIGEKRTFQPVFNER